MNFTAFGNSNSESAIKKKKLILCGDWNINFKQESLEFNELKNLLLVRNLVNTVTAPTRITENTKLLIGVIIIKQGKSQKSSNSIGLGLLRSPRPKRGLLKVRERQFSEENIQGFKYL